MYTYLPYSVGINSVQVPLLGICQRFWYSLSCDIIKFVTDILGILSKNGKNQKPL